jgi:hypothetical protein
LKKFFEIVKEMADNQSDLPEGWKKCYDEKRKKNYYSNKEMRKTQWMNPILSGKDSDNLLPGWRSFELFFVYVYKNYLIINVQKAMMRRESGFIIKIN